MQEATARITINTLLAAARWRFFPDGALPANVQLALSVTLTTTALDALGNDFEQTTTGFVDFLLRHAKGFSPCRPGGKGRGQVHAVTHKATAGLPRDIDELFAESVACIACAQFGLHRSLRSATSAAHEIEAPAAFRAGMAAARRARAPAHPPRYDAQRTLPVQTAEPGPGL